MQSAEPETTTLVDDEMTPALDDDGEPWTTALDDDADESLTPAARALAYQALAASRAARVAVDLHRHADGEVTTYLRSAPLPKKWAIWLYDYGAEQTTEVFDLEDGETGAFVRRAFVRARQEEGLIAVEETGMIVFYGVDSASRFRLLDRSYT